MVEPQRNDAKINFVQISPQERMRGLGPVLVPDEPTRLEPINVRARHVTLAQTPDPEDVLFERRSRPPQDGRINEYTSRKAYDQRARRGPSYDYGELLSSARRRHDVEKLTTSLEALNLRSDPPPTSQEENNSTSSQTLTGQGSNKSSRHQRAIPSSSEALFDLHSSQDYVVGIMIKLLFRVRVWRQGDPGENATVDHTLVFKRYIVTEVHENYFVAAPVFLYNGEFPESSCNPYKIIVPVYKEGSKAPAVAARDALILGLWS